MLKIRKISKTFNPGTVNEKKAITNLNLTVQDGDFITIVGSNGGTILVESDRLIVDTDGGTILVESDRAIVDTDGAVVAGIGHEL